MAYISNEYKFDKNELDNLLANLGEDDATWETLLMVDYAYHNQENEYDGGLSFLDRLSRKLGRFHPNWNVNEWKDSIRNSNNPTDEFIRIVSHMLENHSDVAYYGV